MKFAWRTEKEQENIAKHGIMFSDAVEIFRDPFRKEAGKELTSVPQGVRRRVFRHPAR